MARIKSGPSGLYYDENDSGPDQGSPEEIAAFKAKAAPTTAAAPAAGATDAPDYAPPTGGVTGSPTAKLDDWATNNQTSIAPTEAAPAAAPATSQWGANGVPSTMPQGGYAFMEGVDTAKMNNPNHTTPKYVASRILASGGTIQDAAAAIGATVNGPDSMTLATGETVDPYRDIEGANQLQWLVTNDPNWANTSPAGSGGSGVSGTGGGSGSGSLPGLNGSMSGQAGTLFNYMMGKAGQSLDINRKDPIIANQVNAYDAAQTRAGRDYLRQEAEQAGPQGNLNQEARMVAEKRGQNTGDFQARLMQQELTARRNEIMQSLQLGANFMTEQQRLALQKELAQMDNALSYANLGQRSYEFDANDEFRRSPLAS